MIILISYFWYKLLAFSSTNPNPNNIYTRSIWYLIGYLTTLTCLYPLFKTINISSALVSILNNARFRTVRLLLSEYLNYSINSYYAFVESLFVHVTLIIIKIIKYNWK